MVVKCKLERNWGDPMSFHVGAWCDARRSNKKCMTSRYANPKAAAARQAAAYGKGMGKTAVYFS